MVGVAVYLEQQARHLILVLFITLYAPSTPQHQGRWGTSGTLGGSSKVYTWRNNIGTLSLVVRMTLAETHGMTAVCAL